eukprot:scaffold262822_cov27-Tisochrysis_lutea.AAC.1
MAGSGRGGATGAPTLAFNHPENLALACLAPAAAAAILSDGAGGSLDIALSALSLSVWKARRRMRE